MPDEVRDWEPVMLDPALGPPKEYGPDDGFFGDKLWLLVHFGKLLVAREREKAQKAADTSAGERSDETLTGEEPNGQMAAYEPMDEVGAMRFRPEITDEAPEQPAGSSRQIHAPSEQRGTFRGIQERDGGTEVHP